MRGGKEAEQAASQRQGLGMGGMSLSDSNPRRLLFQTDLPGHHAGIFVNDVLFNGTVSELNL